jgi:hypothetical protein
MAQTSGTTTDSSEQLYELVQWHNKTYKLPKRLPAGVEDRFELERYLENTLRAINSNEATPYDQRLTLLDDQFNFPQLLNEVNGILLDLHDFTHHTGDGPIILSYSAVHDVLKLSEPALFDNRGQQVELDSPDADQRARFYSFLLEVDAAAAIRRANPTLGEKINIEPAQFHVAISLPVQQIENQSVVIESVAETFCYPSLTLNAVKNHYGREPVYGYTNKQPARLYMSLEPKPFLTEFKDYVNKCCFQVYHLLLRDEFLPTTPFDAGAIIKAI